MIINGNHQTKENDESHITNCLTSDQKNQMLNQRNDSVVKVWEITYHIVNTYIVIKVY